MPDEQIAHLRRGHHAQLDALAQLACHPDQSAAAEARRTETVAGVDGEAAGARHDLVIDMRFADQVGVEATAKMTRHPGDELRRARKVAAR
jgi:hypothetical protein